MNKWVNGIYRPEEDVRGLYIRTRMKEKYPHIEDEFAVMWYGTEEEKAEHSAYRAKIKEEADRWYPKTEQV